MSEDSFEIRSGRRGAALVGGLALAYATFTPAAISPDGPWATALARGGDAITSIIPMADTAIGTILAGGGFTAAIVAAGAWVGAKTYSAIRRHWTDLDDDERSTIRDARETRAYGAAADRIAGTSEEGTAYFEVEDGALRELDEREFKRRAAEVRSADQAVEVREVDGKTVAVAYRSGAVQAVHRGRKVLAAAALAVGLTAPALQHAQADDADDFAWLDDMIEAPKHQQDQTTSTLIVSRGSNSIDWERVGGYVQDLAAEAQQNYEAMPRGRSPEEMLKRRAQALLQVDALASTDILSFVRENASDLDDEALVEGLLQLPSVQRKLAPGQETDDGMRQRAQVMVEAYRWSTDTPEPSKKEVLAIGG